MKVVYSISIGTGISIETTQDWRRLSKLCDLQLEFYIRVLIHYPLYKAAKVCVSFVCLSTFFSAVLRAIAPKLSGSNENSKRGVVTEPDF